MEWLKERIFEFEYDHRDYTEKGHIIVLLYRSDGTMWYQVARKSFSRKCDFEDGGHLHCFFQKYLKEKTDSPQVTQNVYDLGFEELMRKYNGREVTREELFGEVNA